jgi:iron-sulfur cluster insertion protein
MITVTDSAKSKILDILTEENNPGIHLRTFVQGGGCSGFNYGFTIEETVNSDDFEIELDSKFKLLIDAISMQYLTGCTIDYKGSFMSKEFIITNPNAKHTCGCGSSFGV